MLVVQLGRTWQLDIYNENNPAAFEDWFLRDLPTIHQLVSESHAPIVLFKPILETYRASHLLKSFPDSRIIFAFRHYHDVINSSLKKFGEMNRISHVNSWIQDDFSEFADLLPPSETQQYIRDLWRPNLSPQAGAALYWLFQNRLFFDLGLLDTNNARLVCYEAVVADPISQFASLCDFLGVRFESSMTKGIFDSSIHRDSPPIIIDHIRQECEQMWQRLTMTAKVAGG